MSVFLSMKWIALVASVLFFLFIFYLILLSWEDRTAYHITVSSDFSWDEESIIALSRRCLGLHKLNNQELEPVSVLHESKQLISYDSDDGSQMHTLWHDISAVDYYFNYYVEIEKGVDDKVTCIVGRPH